MQTCVKHLSSTRNELESLFGELIMALWIEFQCKRFRRINYKSFSCHKKMKHDRKKNPLISSVLPVILPK